MANLGPLGTVASLSPPYSSVGPPACSVQVLLSNIVWLSRGAIRHFYLSSCPWAAAGPDFEPRELQTPFCSPAEPPGTGAAPAAIPQALRPERTGDPEHSGGREVPKLTPRSQYTFYCCSNDRKQQLGSAISVSKPFSGEKKKKRR